MHFSVQHDKTSYRVLDGEAVLIHTETDIYYSLNKSGTLLWNLMAEGAATSALLVEALVRRYGVESGTAEEDVGTLLRELRENDLVKENGVTSGTTQPGLPEGAPDEDYQPPRLEKYEQLQQLMVCGE